MCHAIHELILVATENPVFCVLLIGAIYRYYESWRRIHNDSQPERHHAVDLMQKKQRKLLYASR